MRHVGWTATFLLLAPITAFGAIGLKAGPVASGLYPSHADARPTDAADFRPFLGYEVDWIQHGGSYPDIGIQLGVFYTVRLTEKLALQPELYYAQRGYHFEEKELYDASYSAQIDYLQTPVLVRWGGSSERGFRPSLLAGPYMARRLRAYRTISSWGERDRRRVSGVGTLDFGLILAAGAEFSAWSQRLTGEVRFDWGLANAMRQPREHTDLYTDPGKAQVLAISFLVGYRFRTSRAGMRPS